MVQKRPIHSVERGLFVRRWPGDGGHLVFLHGLGESGLCFEQLAGQPELAGWNRWVLDLPGYGRSAWPEQPPSLQETAFLVERWLGERRLTPAVLVGHSMGGVLALLIAELQPRSVRALIDVDGNKSTDDCVYSGPAAAVTRTELEQGALAGIRESMLRDDGAYAAIRGYYVSLRLCDPHVFHAHARELMTLSSEESLADRLGRLQLPTHYLAGSPGGASARSLELLRKAGVATTRIEESGHWPFIDQPRKFLAALEAFLTSLGN